MKAIKSSLALILIILFLSVVIDSFAEENKVVSLKIGLVLPLSGDLALLGQEVQRGIELAADELKKHGHKLKLIYEDDQSLVARQAASAARKLTSIDNVDLALSLIVEEARPMAPIFNKAATPLLLLWDSNLSIRSAGKYIFSNGFSTEAAGRDMARFAFERLNLKKLAIAKHINPWAEVITDSFRSELLRLGGEIVYFQEFAVEETDYKAAILEIKRKNPDGVYLPMIPMSSALFFKQAGELGLKTQFLSGDPLIQDVIDKGGPAVEGTYYTNYFADNSHDISTRYKSKFQSLPADAALVSFGYEGIQLVLKAKKLSLTKSISLRDAFEELLGKTRSADKIQRIYRVSGGKPVLAAQ